ncbi:hypothetical protein [uncultured Ferrimonas sp.]|uniref:hypothetical protein n=1 Tax=uncultured Ferrimonas sp. TaxID=432640 RepID=UPI002607CEAB|nr:hypothetical protein [uncultured Ferrimonas sp.]
MAPEQVALTFFEAIYINNAPDLARTLVSEEIGDVLQHYRVASQIQRNVFGLPLSNVRIGIADVDADFFRRKNAAINVLIQLEGYQGERLIREDRRVKLVNRNNEWIIIKLYDDPFTTNG